MIGAASQSPDVYRPERSVSIDGTALSPDVMRDVFEVSFVDDIDDIDVVTLKISNAWDPQTRKFPYSGHDQFAPGRRLELGIGYRGGDGLVRMMQGTITSISPLYPSEGPSLLVVRARSLEAELLKTEETRVYTDVTDSQIAKDIAGRLNVKLVTDPRSQASEPTHKYVVQFAQYDLVFLIERARRLGYEVMIEKRGDNFELYFGPSQHLHSNPLKLQYGVNLHEFSPELNTADQVEKVTVDSWDPINKKRLTATATRSDFPGLAKLDSSVSKAFRGKTEMVADLPVNDEATVRAIAKGTMERIMKRMTTGYGSTSGTPDIRAGRLLDITGLDERFNGTYFVTGSKHTFGPNGYHTMFTCRREEA